MSRTILRLTLLLGGLTLAACRGDDGRAAGDSAAAVGSGNGDDPTSLGKATEAELIARAPGAADLQPGVIAALHGPTKASPGSAFSGIAFELPRSPDGPPASLGALEQFAADHGLAPRVEYRLDDRLSELGVEGVDGGALADALRTAWGTPWRIQRSAAGITALWLDEARRVQARLHRRPDGGFELSWQPYITLADLVGSSPPDRLGVSPTPLIGMPFADARRLLGPTLHATRSDRWQVAMPASPGAPGVIEVGLTVVRDRVAAVELVRTTSGAPVDDPQAELTELLGSPTGPGRWTRDNRDLAIQLAAAGAGAGPGWTLTIKPASSTVTLAPTSPTSR